MTTTTSTTSMTVTTVTATTTVKSMMAELKDVFARVGDKQG
jgi:hypothetical protein